MPAPNRKLSGLLSGITEILGMVQEVLEQMFSEVEVCDTRDQCVNLRVTAADGRVFGFRLALCANDTTKMLRQFVRVSLADHRINEHLNRRGLTNPCQEETRIFMQIARSRSNNLDRLVTRITTAIKDIINRWQDFGPCLVAGVHVRGGNVGSSYERIKNLMKMAGIKTRPLSTQT
ncbi:MAG: hypothetical protein P8J32_02315 [bacterium]|nr:hypothetical protein [bacterium]